MTLRSATLTLFLATGVAALAAPATAEQVFQNVNSGHVAPLPTPDGYAALYSGGYYYPCYWYGSGGPGYGSDGRSHGHGVSNSGTINGERFYPYDPRSNSGHQGWSQGWNCSMNQGGHTYPSPRPRPTQLPLPHPPRRIPQAGATPRS